MARRRDTGGGGSEFDARGFVERWRRIEPQLRQRVARFGVTDEDAADELLSDVALRMLKVRVAVDDDRRMLLLADTIARRIVLDGLRAEKRRGGRAHPDVPDALPLPPEDELDAEERAVLRLTLMEKFASLSKHDRRAVALILRGGPYTAVERVVMYRARPRLREAFEDMLGGAVGLAGTGRLWRLRARLSEPHPVVPLLAAASSALTLGGFAVSGAATDRVTQPAGPAIARSPSGEAVAAAMPLGASGAMPAAPAALPRPNGHGVHGGGVADSAVSASVVARLPQPSGQGVVSITVETGTVAGQPVPAWANHSVTVNCDSDARRRACEALGPLAG